MDVRESVGCSRLPALVLGDELAQVGVDASLPAVTGCLEVCDNLV